MEIKGNKKQQTETRIKEIGQMRLLEYGLKETMFRDIAKDAKVDRRTIYNRIAAISLLTTYKYWGIHVAALKVHTLPYVP